MRAFVAFAVLALAACDAPAPRVDSQGEAARAAMDAATAAFAACIEAQANSIDVAGEPAGSLAIVAVKACGTEREALVTKVAEFNAIGYPSRTPLQVQAVAEASVKILEDEARNAAVVTIVKRQGATPQETSETES
jgi:hypothetical protein